MRRGTKKRAVRAFAATAAILGAVPAFAQTPNSSFGGTIGLVSKAEIDTNRNLAPVSPGATFNFTQDLKLTLQAETRVQRFRFSIDSGLRIQQTPGGGASTTFDDPRYRLNYSRQAARADLSFGATFWSRDVNSAYDADPSQAVFIIVDSGSVAVTGANFTLNTGVGGPLQVTTDVAYDKKDFTGITNPLLFDTEQTSAGVTANARLSPVTQASLGVQWTDYKSADAVRTRSETMAYTATLSHELRQGLTIDGSLGFQDRLTRTTGGNTRLDGLNGSLDLTQLLPDGSIFGGVNFDKTGAADRVGVSLGRSLDLPDGTLSGSITANDVQGTGLQYTGNASYTKMLASGNLNVDLNRSLSTNQSNQDVLFTQLALGYQQQLTTVSNLNFSVGFSRTEDGGAGNLPTQNRTTITASYDQQVTPDWNMSVGVRHRQYSSSTTPSANSNTLFLTLSRNIQFAF